MCLRSSIARQALALICVMACSTMAVGTGKKATSTPIRIMPPAMPKMPDKNEVKMTAGTNQRKMLRLMMTMRE
jgi:hypothetical protein